MGRKKQEREQRKRDQSETSKPERFGVSLAEALLAEAEEMGEPELAEDIVARLRKKGWEPGVPHGYPALAVAIDEDAYKGLWCPSCMDEHNMVLHRLYRRRKLRIVATCAVCGAGEEV